MAGAADFFATLFLLSSHHLLSLALGIFKSFLLFKSLCFFLLCPLSSQHETLLFVHLLL